VFLAGAFVKGVHLPLSHWLVAAASILLALLPLVALGVLLGTAVRPETLQGLFSGLFFLLALFGGIWFPLDVFPGWLADVCKVLPSYWVNDAGRAAVAGTWIGWTGLAVAVGWTLVLARCSGFVYARSSERR
jgi:ABC-2 type transport system permease protein